MQLDSATIILALAGTIATMAVTFFKVCIKIWNDFKQMHEDQMDQRKEEVKIFSEKIEKMEARQVKQLAIAIDIQERTKEIKQITSGT